MVDLFNKAKEAFNRGDFFAAHELWEEIWQDIRLNKPASDDFHSLQALIQIAVALHLIQESRLVGANKVLERARLNLDKSKTSINDIDIQALYQEIIRFLANSDLENCLNVKI